jgi:hypothetical protein
MEGFEIGSRVRDTDGYRATVRYIGPVAAAKRQDEVWLGVEWDKKDRGKHDGSCVDKAGTLHRYFQCVNGAGSFVKGNKIVNGTSLVHAIKERYVGEDAPTFTKENDPTLPDAFVTTSKGNAKPIEFHGEHKLRKWQQISGIDKVAIRDDRIDTAGDGLKELAGHLVELDLQDNLLWAWTEVGKLTCEISGLQTLLLHGNRMQQITAPVLANCPTGSFMNLRTLALNACNIHAWAEVQTMEPYLKNIEELYLSANSLTDLYREEDAKKADEAAGVIFTSAATAAAAAASVVAENTWQNLRILDISGCGLEEWSQVAYFRGLPALQELLIDGNPVPRVQPQGQERQGGFASLQRMSISHTSISDWSDVDAIASYESVSNVRMSNVPLFKGKGASQVRPIVISRVKNLDFFNGSIVGRRERMDGEKGYLRSIMMDIADATKEGRPMSQEALTAKHPRYEELSTYPVILLLFLSFLVCDVSVCLSLVHLLPPACLHSLTPHDTSLTIIPLSPSTIPSLLTTIQYR